MALKQQLVRLLLGLAVALAFFGWSDSFLTLATNDPTHYQSVYLRGAVFLSCSELILGTIAFFDLGGLRRGALILLLANLLAIFSLAARAPYVWP